MFDQARKYAWYYLNAKTKHGVHSPFVYDLVTQVLEDKTEYPEYAAIEKLRMSLLNNKLVTEVEDFGAGAAERGATYERKVSEIAAKAAKPAKWGKLLYRLCRYFQPKHMLELGTSLGISSAYQAAGAASEGQIPEFHTLEGSANLVELSQINLKDLGLAWVNGVQGNFDETLQPLLDGKEKVDYAFIDGNHRKEPTLRYFEQLLPKCHTGTLLIFDDIYWSKEMSEAWEEIKAHPRVTVSVDLFYLGLVFLREEQAEEHFVIRF